jgi:High-temperature-induced dauer-formation protein
LLLAITSRLFALKNHPSFPNPDLAPEKDALNCIRVLTRILPFLCEADNLESWEERFFWSVRRRRTKKSQAQGEVIFDEANPDPETPATPNDEDFEEAKPLAEELIDTLVDLLFFTNFTVLTNAPAKSKVSYSIWSSGVGCNPPVSSNAHLESNRTEVLRLLLTLASKSMYLPANVLPTKGVRALTYLATCPDKQVVLSMLCSFLNTALKFHPGSWTIPYNHVVVGDPKHLYVATSLQFLLALVVYPVPEDRGVASRKNYFRHFLGRLHRPQDFQFICDGMSRTLHQPLTATSSYLPGAQKPVRWAAEMIMLFWETIQCNKRFRAFVVDTDRGHDFLVLILYYAIENRADPAKQGVVRMCVFVLQTLSVEVGFGERLKKSFAKQETLPQSIRIDNWKGTYGDFLIVSIHTLITGSKGKLDAVYPALLAIINNVAPHLENLNALSSLKLLQLYNSMSSPSFLLANETNHDLLASLLEAMNAIIEHKYTENTTFVGLILKHRKRFEALRSFTLESGQEEIARLEQQRKEQSQNDTRSPSRVAPNSSTNGPRSPPGPPSGLSNVPEEESGAFTIGEDDDSDGETAEQPSVASPSTQTDVTSPTSAPAAGHSRTGSVASSTADDSMPTQMRGMSEKARGKMPAGTPTFSRTSSTHSLTGHGVGANPGFAPTPQWVSRSLIRLFKFTNIAVAGNLALYITSTHHSDTHRSVQLVS